VSLHDETKGPHVAVATGNLLLDALTEGTRNTVLALTKHVDLPLHTMLHEQSEMPTYAYFLRSGVASVVVSMPEGGSAEVGLIGREGVIGALHIIGPTPAPAQCFLQMEELRRRMLEFVQQQSVTLGQIAACNKLHEAEARLARWLLMSRDRATADTMTMTQEFLADMLGTRRTTVTLVAGSLARQGMIDYKRGKVTVLDRAALERTACDCYRVTKEALVKLYQ